VVHPTPMSRAATLCLLLAACGSKSQSQSVQITQPIPSSATARAPTPSITLPTAVHGEPLLDAPVVSLASGKILFEGQPVGDVRVIQGAGRLRREDGLFDAAKANRERWKQAHPDRDFPGVALFALDVHTSALVVKSLFQTVAFAGFPNAQFEVRGPDGTPQRLDLDAIVPGPPNADLVEPEKVLFVGVTPSKLEIVWKRAGEVLFVADVASSAELGGRIQQDWKLQGEHSDPVDKHFDQVVLAVPNDVELGAIIAVADAIKTATRTIRRDDKVERVPAFNVSLGMAEKAH